MGNQRGGEGFAVGARLELECAGEGNVCIEEGIFHIGGADLLEPTVWPEEFVLGEDGSIKNNYKLTFDCPPFISSCNQIVLNRQGKAKKYIDGNYRYEYYPHTTYLPNIKFLQERGITPDYHPDEWNNIFMPRSKRRQDSPEVVLIADFTSYTNKKAYLYNSGKDGTQ